MGVGGQKVIAPSKETSSSSVELPRTWELSISREEFFHYHKFSIPNKVSHEFWFQVLSLNGYNFSYELEVTRNSHRSKWWKLNISARHCHVIHGYFISEEKNLLWHTHTHLSHTKDTHKHSPLEAYQDKSLEPLTTLCSASPSSLLAPFLLYHNRIPSVCSKVATTYFTYGWFFQKWFFSKSHWFFHEFFTKFYLLSFVFLVLSMFLTQAWNITTNRKKLTGHFSHVKSI